MADTTVTTGKTIDQLDKFSELTTEQKSAFKNSGLLPVRGSTSSAAGAELSTLGMTINDIVPAVPTADGTTITNTANIISVANPVPDPNDQVKPATDGDVLTYDATADEIVWAAPAGGGASLPNVPSDYGNSCYVLGIKTTDGTPFWTALDNGSGGIISFK